MDFLADSGIQLVEVPPYSPALVLCDFWLFPTTKKKLCVRFSDRVEVLKAFEAEFEKLEKADFQQCFDSWLHRLEKCVRVGGDYVEKS